MHELAVTQSILDISIRHAKEADAKRVTGINIVMIRNLVIGCGVTGAFKSVPGLDLSQFWRHSLHTAGASRWLAQTLDRNSDLAFTVGLVHGVGQLVMHAAAPAAMKRLVFFGLDSAIRGEGDEEDRPDMALIDDPETREVAFSPTNKHQDVEDMIDGDVAGLSGPNKKMIRVVLTTIQNCNCYSYRVTDRSVKPAFAGDRYALLSTWPAHRDMWDEYIAIRQKDQFEGKKDGPTATQFYRDNFAGIGTAFFIVTVLCSNKGIVFTCQFVYYADQVRERDPKNGLLVFVQVMRDRDQFIH